MYINVKFCLLKKYCMCMECTITIVMKYYLTMIKIAVLSYYNINLEEFIIILVICTAQKV